jgi:hypothetical protein
MSTRAFRIPAALFAVAAIVAVLAACSVSQVLVIKADGSGTATLRVVTTKLLREYILDLQEVTGTAPAPDGSIFDVKKLQQELAARPGLTVKKVASPSPDVLEVELAYRSVEEVYGSVEAVKKSGLVLYSEAGGQKSLKVHIDRKNFKELSSVFPGMNNAAFEGIAPQEQDTITESEYLDMIQFTLGPDGPAALKGSFIDLVVKPEGAIVSQTGGTVTNGSVTFRIPLIRLLLLDKPLDYALVWK